MSVNRTLTRKSSCVNARGIPPAAQQVHALLVRWWGGYPSLGGVPQVGAPLLGGGTLGGPPLGYPPWLDGVPPSQLDGVPPPGQLDGVPPLVSWMGYPPGQLDGVPPHQLDGVPPPGQLDGVPPLNVNRHTPMKTVPSSYYVRGR